MKMQFLFAVCLSFLLSTALISCMEEESHSLQGYTYDTVTLNPTLLTISTITEPGYQISLLVTAHFDFNDFEILLYGLPVSLNVAAEASVNWHSLHDKDTVFRFMNGAELKVRSHGTMLEVQMLKFHMEPEEFKVATQTSTQFTVNTDKYNSLFSRVVRQDNNDAHIEYHALNDGTDYIRYNPKSYQIISDSFWIRSSMPFRRHTGHGDFNDGPVDQTVYSNKLPSEQIISTKLLGSVVVALVCVIGLIVYTKSSPRPVLHDEDHFDNDDEDLEEKPKKKQPSKSSSSKYLHNKGTKSPSGLKKKLSKHGVHA